MIVRSDPSGASSLMKTNQSVSSALDAALSFSAMGPVTSNGFDAGSPRHTSLGSPRLASFVPGTKV